jgi:hypothetical protein
MTFSRTSFDDKQLAILQTAFAQTCHELGILPSDKAGRDCLAASIIALAHTGQFNFGKLVAFAISDYEKRYSRNSS